MGDLISREELRKAFKESGYFTGPSLHWARLLIDIAPKVERPIKGLAKIDENGDVKIELLRPQGEWIPIEKEDDLIDHYWYLVAHEDYKTPIKAKYHSDVPHFTFSANGEEHASYIFEGKITHYMDLPELPKEAENEC